MRGSPDVQLEWEDIQRETTAAQRLGPSGAHAKPLRAQLAWAWDYRVYLAICFVLGAFRALTGNPMLLFCE